MTAGIKISGEKLNNLRFADDVILFAESDKNLNDLIGNINGEGKKDGMKINKKKRKFMCNEIARKYKKNSCNT